MLFRTIKAILLWGYARNTWQYDVLCVLILAFIFLTPKSWFATGELRSREGHQRSSASAPATPLLLSPGLISAELSRDEVERRVREITGRADAKVEAVRPKLNEKGETVAFEVDIR